MGENKNPSTAILVIGSDSSGDLKRWASGIEEHLKRLNPNWRLSLHTALSPQAARAFVRGDLDFVYFKPSRSLTPSALLEYREAIMPEILSKNLAARPWIYLDNSFRHARQHLVRHGVSIQVGSFVEAIVTRRKERGEAA